MKVLITGGAGFLGFHVAKLNIERGHEVCLLDNMLTGSVRNIEWLCESSAHKGTRPIVVYHDVFDAFRGFVPNQIYHLACPASPVWYKMNPIHTLRASIEGTYNMLELCRESNARMLFTSTSEVYGDPEQHPQSEEYWGNVNFTGVRACYDEGKRAAEALIYDYMRKYGVDARVARVFNTYGPRSRVEDGRLISNFISRAVQGLPIEIYGDGAQTRTLCYVDDTVTGLDLMMNHEERLEFPINIGGLSEYSVLDIAARVIEVCDSRSDVVFFEASEDDPKCRKPRLDLAKKHLGWWPSTSLRDGLLKTIEYFEEEVKR